MMVQFAARQAFRMSSRCGCIATRYPFRVTTRPMMIPSSDQSILACMFHILSMRAVFQIGHAIICSKTVPMVDLQACRAWAKKSLRYQLVDWLHGSMPSAAQHNVKIPMKPTGFQDTAGGSGAVSALSTHAPQTRNGVPAFIADDGAPLFRGIVGIHGSPDLLCQPPVVAATRGRLMPCIIAIFGILAPFFSLHHGWLML